MLVNNENVKQKTHLIPGTSHVLGVDASSYRENVNMSHNPNTNMMRFVFLYRPLVVPFCHPTAVSEHLCLRPTLNFLSRAPSKAALIRETQDPEF